MVTIAVTGFTAGQLAFLNGLSAAFWSYAGNKAAEKFFGPPTPTPRIGDIQLQTAEEGAPMTMVMGPEVRSAGEIVWKGAVSSVEQDSGGGGGCGGGPSSSATYGYFASFALSIGQPPPGAVAEAVEKVWLDGRVGYSEDPDVTIISNLLVVSVHYVGHGSSAITNASNTTPIVITVFMPIGTSSSVVFVQIVGVTGNTAANSGANAHWVVNGSDNNSPTIFTIVGSVGNGAYAGGGTATRVTREMRITSPSGGPDMSDLQAGYDVVVTGFTNGANNGTFECISSSMDDITGISYVILDNPGCVAEVAGATATLFQDLPQFNNNHFSALTFHDGSQWQQPDSLIEAEQGAGNVHGRVGQIYLVFERFNLTLFGDRIPNVNCLTRVSSAWTVGQSIAANLDRAGFDPSEYVVSSLTQTCRGYSIRGPVNPASSVAAIMMTFDVIAYQDDEDRLVFVRRKDVVADVIASTELAAHEHESDAPRKSRVRQVRERDLPREVQVRYQNPDRDYQGGMEPAKRTDAQGDGVEQIETGITMDPGPAQDLARRALWSAWANKEQLEIRLPPSRVLLHEGSLVRYVDHGRTWNLLVNKIDFAKSGVITLQGPNDEAAALDFTGSPAHGGADDSGGPGVLEALDLYVIDVAPLSDSHLTSPGVYVASAPRARDKVWIGATLYESSEATDGTFVAGPAIPRAARIGRTLAALGGGVSAYMVDRFNTVDVVLAYGGDLESQPSLDHMLQGKNRAMIGDEMIGYQTATLIGTNTWRLSILLRGLRDTEAAIGQHLSNERFVSLTPGAGIQFVDQSVSLLDQDRYYRSIPSGGIVDDYPTVLEPFDANTVRPFSVFAPRGTRVSGGDLTISASRQTRANISTFSSAPAPLLESVERYEFDIVNSTGTAVLRTLSVTGSPTVLYTAAQQTTDFGSVQAAVRTRIYQIGDYVGRGRVRDATV